MYLKLTLYDAVYHQFVGRTLSLPKMKESETSGIMKGTECSQVKN